MAMLRVCGHPGCKTLTLGELCLEHEAPVGLRAERLASPRRARVLPAVAVAGRTRGATAEADDNRPAV